MQRIRLIVPIEISSEGGDVLTTILQSYKDDTAINKQYYIVTRFR